jgi:hypothetical protein
MQCHKHKAVLKFCRTTYRFKSIKAWRDKTFNFIFMQFHEILLSISIKNM